MILTHEDRRKLWWTQLEINDITEKARLVILHYRANREDYKSDFLHLFAHCARSSNRLSVEGFKLADKRGRRSPRGLERYINLPQYRNKFVAAVLDVQSKIPSDMSPELRARLLRAKSSHLSKPSRNLARFLAHQDSVEVADHIREELHESSATCTF
jgi:hypothetical protein